MNDEARLWNTAPLLRLLLAGLLLTALLLPLPARAVQPDRLIPVGRAVGIKLFSDGVVVVGTSEVATSQGKANPAKACGLREGDIITHINSTEVDSIEDVVSLLQQLEGQPMSIRAQRDDRRIQLSAQAVFCPTDSTYKLGAWIRDSMAGIGTVTYYDPSSGAFGALGHGINDIDTALLMPLQHGSILYATVAGVKKGAAGTPGQLKGAFDGLTTLGSLTANTDGGIFGTLSESAWVEGQAVEVAARSQTHTGSAVILSNITGDSVEAYTVELTKIFRKTDNDCRDYMLKVTDPRLLNTTGGIVQGMSGSPILQDGRLIGAVTHVLLDDPTQGYAISMERMLDKSATQT